MCMCLICERVHERIKGARGWIVSGRRRATKKKKKREREKGTVCGDGARIYSTRVQADTCAVISRPV